MSDLESNIHDQSNNTMVLEIRKKIIELNSIDLRDENKNQIFVESLLEILNNLYVSYKENDKKIEDIEAILEETFSIVFLFCENKNPQVLQLIDPLFNLKSVSKSIYILFCNFLNHLKNYIPETVFSDNVIGFINSDKEIFLKALAKSSNCEITDLFSNSKLYLTNDECSHALCMIFFLTETSTDKQSILQTYRSITNAFIREKRHPPYFIDFLSKSIKKGVIDEFSSFFQKEFFDYFSTDTLIYLFQNYKNVSINIYRILYHYSRTLKCQPLCNAIVYSHVQLLKDSKVQCDISIDKILLNCDIDHLDFEFWNDLGNHEVVNLPDSIVDRLSHNYNLLKESGQLPENVPPFAVIVSKLVSDPRLYVSQEEANEILKQSNDFIAINSLMTMNFSNDILGEPAFWVRYARNYEEERLYINAIECFVFRYRLKQVQLADLLFYNDSQPNDKTCMFIQTVLKEYDKNIVKTEPGLDEAIYKNVNSSLFPDFWTIFRGEKMSQLYNNAPEEKKFFFYYGLCSCSRISISPIDIIHFCKLGKSSYDSLCSMLDGTTTVDFILPLPNEIQSDLLYFISSTLMCTNLNKSNLVKAITFSNGSDFILFLALFDLITNKKTCDYKIFQSNCLYDTFSNVKESLKEESAIRNFNLLISLILKLASPKLEIIIKNTYKMLSLIVDFLWSQYKDNGIFVLFPNFDEFAYTLYAFYLIKDNYLFININDGFPAIIDHDMIQMFFERYKTNKNPGFKNADIDTNNIDVSELLKNPTPELFGFMSEYLRINYSNVSTDQFDENLVISSFLENFKISQDKIQVIDELITSLNEDQIIAIINEFVDFINFDSLIHLIEQKKSKEEQMNILQIENYINFIRAEVYKSLKIIMKENSQHELCELIIDYFRNHSNIKLTIDPNFLNLNEFNDIPISSLFELDDILNSSFESVMKRIYEAIPLLFRYTIHNICNKKEISNEIKTKLFLPSNEIEKANLYELLPTFESFSNLRNVVKYIFVDLFIYKREKDLLPFITDEQFQLIRPIFPIFQLKKNKGLKYHANFIIKACPSFKTMNFPISIILKMHLLNINDKVTRDSLYNVVHMKFCKNSTGVLYYMNLLRSFSNSLNINKDSLLRNLTQFVLNTPESFTCLKKVLSKLFVRTKDDNLFYLDVKNNHLKKPSRQAIFFVRENFLNGPFTQSFMSFLSSFSLAYPDLIGLVFDPNEAIFEDIGHSSYDCVHLLQKLSPMIKNTSRFHIFETGSDTTQIVILLYSVFIRNPLLGDRVMQYILENIVEGNIDLIIAHLYIIRIACSSCTLQAIIVGYLIRYNFVDIIVNLVQKADSLLSNRKNIKFAITQNYDEERKSYEIIENVEENNTENNIDLRDFPDDGEYDDDEDDYAQHIKHVSHESDKKGGDSENSFLKQEEIVYSSIILLTLLIRYEENETSNSSEIAKIISKRKNPFFEFNGQSFSVITKDSEGPIQWSPNSLRIDTRLLTGDQLKSFMFIPFAPKEQNLIIQLVNEIDLVEYNFRPPSDVPFEYFQALPDEYASQLIIDRIPRINERLTANDFELLFKYPPWVMNWITQRPSTILLQQHYDIITDCINQINMMNLSSLLSTKRVQSSFSLVSKQSLNSTAVNSKSYVEKRENILDYKKLCYFIYISGDFKTNDYYKLLHTIGLYICAHKSYDYKIDDENTFDDLDKCKTPIEILIFYIKKMYEESSSATSFCTMIYCVTQIADYLMYTLIDIACTIKWRENPDIFEAILHFYKEKCFYRKGKMTKNTNNTNNLLRYNQNAHQHNHHNRHNRHENIIYINDNDNNNNNVFNDLHIALGNNDIINIPYLLNNHNNNDNNPNIIFNPNNNNNANILFNPNPNIIFNPNPNILFNPNPNVLFNPNTNILFNNNNDPNAIFNNNNTNSAFDNDESEDSNSNDNESENSKDDFSDVDEIYRYDFFTILMMSESPKVLASALFFAPLRLVNAALSRGSCISNAFLRCLHSPDIHKYTSFFNMLQNYKNFYVQHEPEIIKRIRDFLPDWKSNASQIITLFSMLSFETIDDPKKVCEEFYDTLSPFWQLVYDSRNFISIALLDQNYLIDSSFRFMKPVVHTLSFDFRVKYLRTFTRQILSTKTRSIVVRRDNILEDSFKIIMSLTPSEFLGHISVNFDGERGIDAGGLLRDWFTNLTKALFNENYALFVSSKVHGTFLPNPNSYVNGNHLKYFEFAGRIFARALIEQIHLEPHLALALRKKLLKCNLDLEDIEEFDPDLYTSLKWILENNLSDNPDFEMYFTADTDNIGKHEVYELIENGSKTLVTDENKQMFVQKTIEYRTDVAIKDQCCAFCMGFFSILPDDRIGIFSPEELDRIICGESFIDVDDWRRNCNFAGQFSINHPTIITFFNTIKKWSQDDIAQLLTFITGSSRVPLGGFAAYKDFGRPITIGSVDGRDKLITAHTCSNLLDLPIYETETELNDKIRLAIQECNSFDFH